MHWSKVFSLAWIAIFLWSPFGEFSKISFGQSADKSTLPAAQQELVEQQKLLAERFTKLEELFLRMSEFESTTNPARASLLQQAAKQSKEFATAQRMNLASELLSKRQFNRAIEEQKASAENLKKLLELLKSENRQDRVRDERKKYEEWIKEIEKLGRLERSLRGRTENGQDTKQSSKDQSDIESKAKEISDQIGELMKEKGQKVDGPQEQKENEKKGGPSSDDANKDPNKPENGDSSEQDPSKGEQPKGEQSKGEQPKEEQSKGESSQGEQPKGEQPKGEQPKEEPSKGEPSQGEQSKGEQSKGEQSKGEPSKGEPSKGEPSKGEPSKGEQPKGEQSKGEQSEENSSDSEPKAQPPETAESKARKKVEQARQKMQDAIKKLDQGKRKEAVLDESSAEKELKEAVAELEKILRQLREEEVERSLTALEARFRKMLEMQTNVLEETNRLSQLAGDARDRQLEIQSSKLALEEKKILVEGERALLLLAEEGSSTAFPEAVQQMVADVRSVAERLQKSDVGKLTIGIEEEIVTALEEMIQALKQAQKQNDEKKKQKKQNQQQQQEGDQEQQPLVDALAELRLIKTLQLRVNSRTDRLSKMLSDPNDPVGRAQNADLRLQVQELAGRQEKIQEVTRDLVLKNSKKE